MTRNCGAPCETFLCNPCAFRLEQRLAETDSVLADIELAVPRLTLTATYGERMGGSKALHAPAPVNVDALDAKVSLHRFLADTALRLAMATDTPFTNRSPQGLASYLLSNINALRSMDWVGSVLPGLETVMRGCEQAAMVAGERINVGECGYIQDDIVCDNPLTPYRNQRDITCKVCGTVWNVKERQRDAIGGAWLAIDFPPVIIRALADYGITIKPKDFENWVAAGHLKSAAEHNGRKQYRVNEVWAVARRMKERKRKSA